MILQTNHGITFEIDDEDALMFRGINFLIGSTGYVQFWDGARKKHKKLHKVLMPHGLTDHIDRNKLNNKKSNLRYTTHRVNRQNSVNTGAYPKGVTFKASVSKFQARISLEGGARKHLGYFNEIEAACNAYNEAALKFFGPGAALSDPSDIAEINE